MNDETKTYEIVEDGKVSIYEVTSIDIERLMQLKKEIIDTFSTVEHRKFVADKVPQVSDKVRNLTFEPQFPAGGLPITYDVEADYYTFPRVVDVIDEIVAGRSKAISVLMTMSMETAPMVRGSIVRDLQEVSDTLKSSLPYDLESVLKKVTDAEMSLYNARATGDFYYAEVRNCINSKLLGTLGPEETGFHM